MMSPFSKMANVNVSGDSSILLPSALELTPPDSNRKTSQSQQNHLLPMSMSGVMNMHNPSLHLSCLPETLPETANNHSSSVSSSSTSASIKNEHFLGMSSISGHDEAMTVNHNEYDPSGSLTAKNLHAYTPNTPHSNLSMNPGVNSGSNMLHMGANSGSNANTAKFTTPVKTPITNVEAYLGYLSRQKKETVGGSNSSVWSEDVEQAFMEALIEIPSVGRRKIANKGRTCGRNELISELILQKTGKFRSRKQVSSHIQVLKHLLKDDPGFMALVSDNTSNNINMNGTVNSSNMDSGSNISNNNHPISSSTSSTGTQLIIDPIYERTSRSAQGSRVSKAQTLSIAKKKAKQPGNRFDVFIDFNHPQNQHQNLQRTPTRTMTCMPSFNAPNPRHQARMGSNSNNSSFLSPSPMTAGRSCSLVPLEFCIWRDHPNPVDQATPQPEKIYAHLIRAQYESPVAVKSKAFESISAKFAHVNDYLKAFDDSDDPPSLIYANVKVHVDGAEEDTLTGKLRTDLEFLARMDTPTPAAKWECITNICTMGRELLEIKNAVQCEPNVMHQAEKLFIPFASDFWSPFFEGFKNSKNKGEIRRNPHAAISAITVTQKLYRKTVSNLGVPNNELKAILLYEFELVNDAFSARTFFRPITVKEDQVAPESPLASRRVMTPMPSSAGTLTPNASFSQSLNQSLNQSMSMNQSMSQSMGGLQMNLNQMAMQFEAGGNNAVSEGSPSRSFESDIGFPVAMTRSVSAAYPSQGQRMEMLAPNALQQAIHYGGAAFNMNINHTGLSSQPQSQGESQARSNAHSHGYTFSAGQQQHAHQQPQSSSSSSADGSSFDYSTNMGDIYLLEGDEPMMRSISMTGFETRCQPDSSQIAGGYVVGAGGVHTHVSSQAEGPWTPPNSAQDEWIKPEFYDE